MGVLRIVILIKCFAISRQQINWSGQVCIPEQKWRQHWQSYPVYIPESKRGKEVKTMGVQHNSKQLFSADGSQWESIKLQCGWAINFVTEAAFLGRSFIGGCLGDHPQPIHRHYSFGQFDRWTLFPIVLHQIKGGNATEKPTEVQKLERLLLSWAWQEVS